MTAYELFGIVMGLTILIAIGIGLNDMCRGLP